MANATIKGILIGTLAAAAFAADADTGLRAFRQGDYQTAIRVWKTDSDKGDKNAQYNLGLLYMSGA